MVTAVVASPGTSADVVVELLVSEGTVDIPNNRSMMYVTERLRVTAYNGAGGPFKTSPASYGYVNSSLGTLVSVSKGYDLRSSSGLNPITWGTWSGWVTHDADGKKTVTFTYGFEGEGGTPLGNGSGSHSFTLTEIPRGPRIKIGAIWKNTILYIKSSGIWKIALLYIKSSGIWKITGG